MEVLEILWAIMTISDFVLVIAEIANFLLKRRRRLFTLRVFSINYAIALFIVLLIDMISDQPIIVSTTLGMALVPAIFLTFVIGAFESEKLFFRLQRLRYRKKRKP